MTINQVIRIADGLRPNTCSDEYKAAQIMALDGELAEGMNVTVPEYSWPETDDALLMPAPHEDIYVLYLCCQIDLYNQETALYANDRAVYDEALSEARAWWRRHNRAEDKGAVRVL